MSTSPIKPSAKRRSPVVAVLGHVDHGKTTLLDYIRKTNVAAREAGGITQAVGAYEIIHAGQRITFIDTPGHEAFSHMRSRGANIADLAILVVAAEEGPKPQTIESIKILNETKTPFVVAITKTDMPGANLEKVKGDLTAAGVLLEGYGGSVSFQPICAKTGEHVNDLLDLVLLATEMEDLAYDPAAPAEGYVLETRMSRQRGCEATVIVKNGTLRFGEDIATQTVCGKIKILEDFLGKATKTLEPSSPALVVGFEKLPQAGEKFMTGGAASEQKAKIADALRANAPSGASTATYDASEPETMNLILKAGNAGSLEALSQIIRSMTFAKPAKMVAESVGDVVDNDVKLAISTGSAIVAFQCRMDKAAKNLAEANKVPLLSNDIIYHLVKSVEDYATSARIAPAGALEVLAVFNQIKLEKQVVGGKVTEGIFRNKSPFEIERSGAVVGRGRVTNIQMQKKDAGSVSVGNECGLLVNSDIAIQKGDLLVIR